jgi:hypothetical protein
MWSLMVILEVDGSGSIDLKKEKLKTMVAGNRVGFCSVFNSKGGNLQKMILK